MKISIEVSDRAEGERIREALNDAQTRVFLNVMGAVLPLPHLQRQRVLGHVLSYLHETPEPEVTSPPLRPELPLDSLN